MPKSIELIALVMFIPQSLHRIIIAIIYSVRISIKHMRKGLNSRYGIFGVIFDTKS